VYGDAGRATTKDQNAEAISNLTMAFETDALMGLAFQAMTTAWPFGGAWLVAIKLFKKYRPTDRISI
jgi:hypothetical protein